MAYTCADKIEVDKKQEVIENKRMSREKVRWTE